MKIDLLDCTLRDGGYVNNWQFGGKTIKGIKHQLENSNIDMIELGFLRLEKYNSNRSIFSKAKDLSDIMQTKKKNILYSVMIEGGETSALFPIKNLLSPQETKIDYIRVCTWKRLMKEHFSYINSIVKKGYKVSIQPTALNQYSINEFKNLCLLANMIDPFAVYLVDTWGVLSSIQLCNYAQIADQYLNKNIKIGIHCHNNKMQALSCTIDLLKMNLSHDICIDSSVFGMGRGAGNLQTEIIMDYLNEGYNKNYKISHIISIYENYLKEFYLKSPWGYSIYHYLTSKYNCTQDYGTYFMKNNLSAELFETFLKSCSADEKVVFNKFFLKKKLQSLGYLIIGE